MLRRQPPTRLDSYKPEPWPWRGDLCLSLEIDHLLRSRFWDLLMYLLNGLIMLVGASLLLIGMVLIERAL